MKTDQLTVKATIPAPLKDAWKFRTCPEHIVKWSEAAADRHTPLAVNNLRSGGKFSSHIEV